MEGKQPSGVKALLGQNPINKAYFFSARQAGVATKNGKQAPWQRQAVDLGGGIPIKAHVIL